MAAHTPADVDRLFAEYLNAGNLDALVDLYEPEACLLQQDGSVATGRPAIRESLGGLIPMKIRIEGNVFKVVTGGADVAVLYNDWSATLTDPSGNKIPLSGKAFEIVRRQANGTWQFVIDDPYGRG